MAWSTPKTWASGYVVLASDLNTYLRDQQLETAPAKVSAQGDIVYASGANALARLAKDTNSTRSLTNTGGSNNPAWAQVALATGVSGQLPVGSGGTGTNTLTANGAIIGNGSSALTAVDMSTKGGLLAGDGTGNPSVLAVGTNTHVLTADSGEATGLKWATAAGLTEATQSDMEDEGTTAADRYVSPEVGRFGPYTCKAYCNVSGAGALAAMNYNITSTAKTSTGQYSITFDSDFSADTFSAQCTAIETTASSHAIVGPTYTTTVTLGTAYLFNAADAAADLPFSYCAFGDQ